MYEVTVKEKDTIINTEIFGSHKEATDWIFDEISDCYENHDYPDSDLDFEDAEDEYWGANDNDHFWYQSYALDNEDEIVFVYYEIKEVK